MRHAVLAWLAIALAACSTLERPVSDSSKPSAARGSDIVAYLETLQGLGESRLAAEAARQRALAAREPDDVAKVKAAIALSLVPHGDETEILALVEPLAARRGAPPEVRAMASFLQAMASERRRLKESATAAGTRLREERHGRELEKQRADSLQERAAELQQKLDALSELEKSLSDRPPPQEH
jgi:hypothetical protein